MGTSVEIRILYEQALYPIGFYAKKLDGRI
jgi:hypothetical protein